MQLIPKRSVNQTLNLKTKSQTWSIHVGTWKLAYYISITKNIKDILNPYKSCLKLGALH